ncbi:CBS domain-containing protein [Dehalobacter sp. DCM]|uniref:CBS domain-containing protein n=1 Tax=Dehalobacter sp. DCM TaxID=2907827 RepID=UPI0030816CC6|nr:CBS domain-containing protein [Dehalobacter sp. DCM]
MKIILSHQFLDFDALASMVAAQKLYPDAILVIDGKQGSYVQEFFALAKEHLPCYRLKDIPIEQIDKIILVDTQDIHRSVPNKGIVQQLKDIPLEVIDHHPVIESSHENWTIDMVGACTTILVERIRKQGIAITHFEATLMALGIYDDTGSLLFENTTPRDLQAAAFLLENGAQLTVITEYLYKPLTVEQRELFQQLLDNGTIEKYNGISVYITYAECEEYFSGLAQLAERIRKIENADVFFLVVKMVDRVYIVSRVMGVALPVNIILKPFNGGGHEKAASAVIKDAEVPTVIRLLQEEIRLRADRPNTVRDIMSYPVKTVHPETSIEEVSEMLLKYGHTGLPVVQEQKLVGIISRRDVDKAYKHGLLHAPVKGFMTREVITVNPDMGWDEVQRLMILHDIGRIPVIENENLVGIVSRSDMMRLVFGSVVPTTLELARDRSIARREENLKLIETLPQDIQNYLKLSREIAGQLGCNVFLVGGFVRDLLLHTPSNDLDIVVEGNGIAFARGLSKRLDYFRLILHESFGTASLIFRNGTHIDIAGTRREDYEFPGALPVVEESKLKDDLFRRDFTINAMALSLNEGFFGDIIDYYGGYRDLQQREIRFLHNLSFIDDPTRILRAIRFAGRYGFKLAKVTQDAIPIALKENVLANVSADRFSEEFLLIFKEQHFTQMVRDLNRYGVLKAWFQKDYLWNDDVWNDNEMENAQDQSLAVRWLMSIKNVDLTGIKEILNKLNLPKSLQRITVRYGMLREELHQKNLQDMVGVDEILSGTPELLLAVLKQHDEFADILNKYEALLQGIQIQVTGKDLIQRGVREGPEIGCILKQIRAGWLTGKIHNTADEEIFLNDLLKNR